MEAEGNPKVMKINLNSAQEPTRVDCDCSWVRFYEGLNICIFSMLLEHLHIFGAPGVTKNLIKSTPRGPDPHGEVVSSARCPKSGRRGIYMCAKNKNKQIRNRFLGGLNHVVRYGKNVRVFELLVCLQYQAK